jgi:hypothetical protein
VPEFWQAEIQQLILSDLPQKTLARHYNAGFRHNLDRRNNRRARELIGSIDALEHFLKWKSPEER